MKKLDLKFVDSMPQRLEDGILYVSIRFRIVSHNCCCGCGNEVVVNLAPTGWQLTYDGESITLFPSIGNWSLPCRSHYWIRNNGVQWAPQWSPKQIAASRAREAAVNEKSVSGSQPPAAPVNSLPEGGQVEINPRGSLWQKLKKRLHF